MRGTWLSSSMLLAQLVLLTGCAPSRLSSNAPQLYVEILGGGACSVYEVALACSDVPEYLKSTLKVPTETYIAVTPKTADDSILEAMAPVMKSLEAAGYKLVIGSIELKPNKPLQPTAREDARSG